MRPLSSRVSMWSVAPSTRDWSPSAARRVLMSRQCLMVSLRNWSYQPDHCITGTVTSPRRGVRSSRPQYSSLGKCESSIFHGRLGMPASSSRPSSGRW
jgi:hypothetical protein